MTLHHADGTECTHEGTTFTITVTRPQPRLATCAAGQRLGWYERHGVVGCRWPAMVAICGPGRKPAAELLLAVAGERVSQVLESANMPDPDAIYLISQDYDLLLPPFLPLSERDLLDPPWRRTWPPIPLAVTPMADLTWITSGQ